MAWRVRTDIFRPKSGRKREAGGVTGPFSWGPSRGHGVDMVGDALTFGWIFLSLNKWPRSIIIDDVISTETQTNKKMVTHRSRSSPLRRWRERPKRENRSMEKVGALKAENISRNFMELKNTVFMISTIVASVSEYKIY
jgi:hypothetical protein